MDVAFESVDGGNVSAAMDGNDDLGGRFLVFIEPVAVVGAVDGPHRLPSSVRPGDSLSGIKAGGWSPSSRVFFQSCICQRVLEIWRLEGSAKGVEYQYRTA